MSGTEQPVSFMAATMRLITWSHFRISFLRSVANMEKKVELLRKVQSAEDLVRVWKSKRQRKKRKGIIYFAQKHSRPHDLFSREERAIWGVLQGLARRP